ncbi:MAG: glycogen-binding domain-containing protein [Desulfatibacillum sp.]|nr:glycogen-binding domain-containing protein [Desulfatibacillum sp.]
MNLNELLISQYIDDELSLKDKARFLEELAREPEYSQEAIALVRQEVLMDEAEENLLDQADDMTFPASPVERSYFPKGKIFKIVGTVAVAACALVAFLVLLQSPSPSEGVPHRFVLYMPDAGRVAISGSFNGWNSLPMEQPGQSGYWEAVLVLPPGEHRFSYLVEESKRVTDPTILAREYDGFGGMNSILKVETQI